MSPPMNGSASFAKSGYAMDLTDFVAANPWAFADVIPELWESTKYDGKIYAIPQDSEIRMFLYNKDILRKAGKDEAFIEGLPAMVESGEFTMSDLSNLAKEIVDGGHAEIGIIHRPNAGPDYLMTFASFGVQYLDPETGKLLLPKTELQKGLEWFAWNAENGVTPRNNTRWLEAVEERVEPGIAVAGGREPRLPLIARVKHAVELKEGIGPGEMGIDGDVEVALGEDTRETWLARVHPEDRPHAPSRNSRRRFAPRSLPTPSGCSGRCGTSRCLPSLPTAATTGRAATSSAPGPSAPAPTAPRPSRSAASTGSSPAASPAATRRSYRPSTTAALPSPTMRRLP
jgi:hypothetical protein